MQVLKKQSLTEQRIFDLVDAMDLSFDFIEDLQKLKEGAIRMEPLITSMLKQVGECALFVCEYLKPNFVCEYIYPTRLMPALTLISVLP